MSVDAILKEIEALTADERAELKARLLEETTNDVPPMSRELAAELQRRLDNAKANPGVGYTWEEVVAYVKRQK